MQNTAEQIRDFLQFVAVQFIEHPKQAELRMAATEENHIRFRLILAQSDVAVLIGRNGFTASAIRNILKAAAQRDNITTSLQIVSHEEEKQRLINTETKS